MTASTSRCHVVCARVRPLASHSFLPRSSCDCLAALAHPSPRTVAFCLCSKSCAPASSNCLPLVVCPIAEGGTPNNTRCCQSAFGVHWRGGAVNAHRAVEGAKRTTAVQVILHQNTAISLFYTFAKFSIFIENPSLLTQEKLSCCILLRIFPHRISSDCNKCARCRKRAPRCPMKMTKSRITASHPRLGRHGRVTGGLTPNRE